MLGRWRSARSRVSQESFSTLKSVTSGLFVSPNSVAKAAPMISSGMWWRQASQRICFDSRVWRSGSQLYRRPAVSVTSEILDFVGPRSKLLFDLLEIPTDFLNTEEWYKSTEYETAKKALKALSATNDSAERAIALAVTFNTKITRDEQSYQELLQVVEYHRKTYKFNTKKDLKKFF